MSVALFGCSLYYAADVTSKNPEWRQSLSHPWPLAKAVNSDLEMVGFMKNLSDIHLLEYSLKEVLSFMILEPRCIWTLINMAYCLLILLGHCIQLMVFGELRVSEQQQLKEKFWNFVFYKFIFMFGVINVQHMDEVVLWCSWFSVLGFLLLLAQLSKDRLEYLSFFFTTPRRMHLRLLCLLFITLAASLCLLGVCIFVRNHGGVHAFAFMAAESLLLLVRTCHVISQYVIHLYEVSHSRGVLESRGGAFIYWVELTFELLALGIDLLHHVHMLVLSNMFLSMASLIMLDSTNEPSSQGYSFLPNNMGLTPYERLRTGLVWHKVLQLFPDMSSDEIREELMATWSVEEAVESILERREESSLGEVPHPAPYDLEPLSSSHGSFRRRPRMNLSRVSSSPLEKFSAVYRARPAEDPMDSSPGDRFSKDSVERETLLQERKKRLLLEALHTLICFSILLDRDDVIRTSGSTKNSQEIESQLFKKAKNKDDYLRLVARVILHMTEMNKMSSTNPQLAAALSGGSASSNAGTQNADVMHRAAQPPTSMLQNQLSGPPSQQMSQLAAQLSQPNQMTLGMNTHLQNQLSQPPRQQGIRGYHQGMQGPVQGHPIPMVGPGGAGMGPRGMSLNVGPGARIPLRMPGGPGPSPLTRHLQPGTKPDGPMMSAAGPGYSSILPSPTSDVASLQSSPSSHMGQPGLMSGGMPVMVAPSPASHVLSSNHPPHPLRGGVMDDSSSPITVNTPASVPGGYPTSSSASYNAPASAGARTGSDEASELYLEKIQQLSKYIEPLRRMIDKIGDEDHDKLSKMKKLLDLLRHPDRRVPMETLLKCEQVLERMDFMKPTSEGHGGIFQPLMDALNQHLKSPLMNHSLQRTFLPTLEAMFGPEIKFPSPPPKRKCKRLGEEENAEDGISDILQGEIARMDPLHFQVHLESGRTNVLRCSLEERLLPCMPMLRIAIPKDYPTHPPICLSFPPEYNSTPLLRRVKIALEERLLRLPQCHSLSEVLDAWEMANIILRWEAPRVWKLAHEPIFKGDYSNPRNHRQTDLTNIMGKLMKSIFKGRISESLGKRTRLIRESQHGF
ncbi:unnamed protein product [Darwinula stevensoni]|uniref:Mediator of RNA polymerase II transcription subunit 15 n=1 Tax=Darwinula stevensoni TaxID=69355 RepID=A0A7R8XFA2_9CRUS|nr:unnamed protein product [Darwinula stevensoni]CAG0888610.1 unnamed protein product [Darwinula stevensoni]